MHSLRALEHWRRYRRLLYCATLAGDFSSSAVEMVLDRHFDRRVCMVVMLLVRGVFTCRCAHGHPSCCSSRRW